MKELKPSIALLCLVFVLAGCSGSAGEKSLSQTEAISLAKAAAVNSPSGPRVYKISLEGNGIASRVREWPDVPGSTVGTHIVGGGCVPTATGCGAAPSLPITFTTSVVPDNSGQDVIFSAIWQWDEGKQTQHSWTFYVDNNRHVEFKGEDGDQLPDLPR